MDGAISLVIILSAGYLFCVRCYLTRYLVARQVGYKLYLSSGAVGVIFLFVAHFAYYLQNQLWWITGLDYLFVIENAELPYFLSILAFALAILVCEVYNSRSYAKATNLWKAWHKDDLESICAYAQEGFKLISVTLDTRKVYVGYVFDSLEPDNSQSHLTVIPIYSGYRKEDNQKMELNHTYEAVITLLSGQGDSDSDFEQIKDYCITFSRDRIVTINIFNAHLYDGFHKELEPLAK